MSWKILPVNRLIGALVVLLLVAGFTNAWAQEHASTGSGPSVEPPTDASTAEAAEQAASPSAPAADPSNENSPFDYQASEEISQDRSVSFPVDI